MPQTKIYITRHGVTTWNKEGRMQGHTDIPLHPDAYDEVKLLAYKMKEFAPYDFIYTSHLTRAIQTGQIIQDILGVGQILHFEDLSERGYGPYEGRIFQEVISELEKVGKDFFREDSEGVEPCEAFAQRVLDAFSWIEEKHKGQTVLVVTHGGSIHHLIRHLKPDTEIRHVPNSSLFLYQPETKSIHQIF